MLELMSVDIGFCFATNARPGSSNY